MARDYTKEYQEIIRESFELGQDPRQLAYDYVAWQNYTQPNIENIISVPVKETALDIGCAYGTTSVFLKKIGWNKVIGIDITDRYVNKKLFDKYQIEFKQSNIMTDSIPSVDLIVFTEILEHLCGDIQGIFNKLSDALNPDGYIVLSTPLKGVYCAEPIGKDLTSYMELMKFQGDINSPIDDHYYLYSPGEIEELCKNANLIIKKQNIEKWLHYLLQKSQLAS